MSPVQSQKRFVTQRMTSFRNKTILNSNLIVFSNMRRSAKKATTTATTTTTTTTTTSTTRPY